MEDKEKDAKKEIDTEKEKNVKEEKNTEKETDTKKEKDTKKETDKATEVINKSADIINNIKDSIKKSYNNGNLNKFINLALIAVLLPLIFIVISFISMGKAINSDKALKIVSSAKSLVNWTRILDITILLLVASFLYRLYREKKDKINIKGITNIVTLLSIISVTTYRFLSNSFTSILKTIFSSLKGLKLDSINSLNALESLSGIASNYSVEDIEKLSDESFLIKVTVVLGLSIVFLIVAIFLNYKKSKTNKEVNINIDKDKVKSNLKKVEGKTKEVLKNHKNKIIKAIIAIVVVLVIIFGGKFAYNKLKPDYSVVSAPEFSVSFDGVDGLGTAYATMTKYPELKKEKKDVKGNINISADQIQISKKDGLKNGEKIIVKLNIENKNNLSIKGNTDFAKEFEVKDLKKGIVKFSDIPEQSAKRIEAKVNEKAKNYSKDAISFKKVKVLEKDGYMDNQSFNSYQQIYIFDLEAKDTSWFRDSDTISEYVIYSVKNFDLKGNYAGFDVMNKDSRDKKDISLEELVSTFEAEGFKEVKENK